MKGIKKILIVMLMIMACVCESDAKSYYLGSRRAKPYHVSQRQMKPSWMTEYHSSRRQRNPFTGQKAKQKSTDPNKYYHDNSYLPQFGFMLDAGFKNCDYPYYHSELLSDNTSSLMPCLEFDAFMNLGSVKRNFGFLGGISYSFAGISRQSYDFIPDDKCNIIDYKVGITIMQYASVGFAGEYNEYFKYLQGEDYRVDKNHYGFYIMGMYKFSHYVGVNAGFTYIFNKQYNNYNMVYNKDMYNPLKKRMTDYKLTVGLTFYF